MKSKPSKTKTQAKTERTKPAKSAPRMKTAAKKSGSVAAGKAVRSRSTKTVATRTASPRGSVRSSASPSDLLRAGLSALSLPRAESAVADGLSRIADSFGLKKLEDVFDNRVAAAMARIGYPSAKELTKFVEQVAELVKLLNSQKTRR